jgi:hypothetical protein
VLLIPEHVPCEGPSMPLLNILRGLVWRTLGADVFFPPPRGTNSDSATITADIGSTNASGRATIVLIRRDVSRRGVSNFEELLEAFKLQLTAYQILVHTGKETLVEQWNMFRLAEAAAGPHGAAWSNVVAMRPRSVAFEFLVRGKDVNLCFMSAALKLGLVYRAVSPEGSTHGGTMTVDVRDVVKVMSEALLSVENRAVRLSTTTGLSSSHEDD